MDLLLKHISETHPNISVLLCKKCDRTYSSKSSFTRHENLLHKERSAFEETCIHKNKCIDKEKLIQKEDNISSLHGFNRNITSFPNISENWMNDFSLKIDFGNGHFCPECGKPNFSKRALNQHMKKMHKCSGNSS